MFWTVNNEPQKGKRLTNGWSQPATDHVAIRRKAIHGYRIDNIDLKATCLFHQTCGYESHYSVNNIHIVMNEKPERLTTNTLGTNRLLSQYAECHSMNVGVLTEASDEPRRMFTDQTLAERIKLTF